MTTTRTLVLAGLTALSAGVGTAMAQQTPTGQNAYWDARERATAAQSAPAATERAVEPVGRTVSGLGARPATVPEP